MTTGKLLTLISFLFGTQCLFHGLLKKLNKIKHVKHLSTIPQPQVRVHMFADVSTYVIISFMKNASDIAEFSTVEITSSSFTFLPS